MPESPSSPLLALLETMQPLSAELRAALASRLRREELPRGTHLLQPGQVAHRLYFVERGVVRGFYLKDGREVSSWFMKEQDFIISIVSFFTQTPSLEYVELLEDATLWSLSYSQLQHLYQQFPAFNYVGRVLTENYYVLSERRTLNLRLQSAPARYEQLLADFPAIFQRVPLKHIASHLGLTPETLSRLRGRR